MTFIANHSPFLVHTEINNTFTNLFFINHTFDFVFHEEHSSKCSSTEHFQHIEIF